MSDPNQQPQGQPQSSQAATSGIASRYNPWEGTPDPGENEDGPTTSNNTGTTSGVDASGQTGQATQKGTGHPPGQQSQGQASQGATGTDAGPGGGEGQAGAPGAVQATPKSGLTAEEISQIVARTVAAVPQAQPQQQQPQFTEQDFIKTFNVFQPTAEILASIGLPSTPETVQGFNSIATAIVKQSVTMAAYQMQKLQQDLEAKYEKRLAQFEPARQMAEEKVNEQLKEEFLGKNPDLKGFEPLVLEIRDRLMSQGVQFKTKEEAFQTLATHARKILQQIPGLQAGGAGEGQQAVQQPQSTTTTSGASRMSALSGAGQGGAGQNRPSAAQKPKKNTAETLFGS